MAKYPATAETSTRRGQQGQSQNWLPVSGDIYDVWVPEQGWLSWLTALIWGVIQSLGAYTRTGFDAIYCYGMWPHSEARCRDWIVLFAAHLCVCQAGLMACWPQFQSVEGCFFFVFFNKNIYLGAAGISRHKDLCDQYRFLLWFRFLPSVRRSLHHQIKSWAKRACRGWSHAAQTSEQTNWKCERPCHRCHLWRGGFHHTLNVSPVAQCLSCRDECFPAASRPGIFFF